MAIQISSAFDGGNIRVLDASNRSNIKLEIAPDAHSSYFQWFYFRLVGAQGSEHVLNLVNAGNATFGGWQGYRAVASYDRHTWFRVDTVFDGQTLTIRHAPRHSAVYYASFAPYSMERHGDLIARSLGSGLAELEPIGQSLDGQDIDLLRIGNTEHQRPNFWVVARQHPGETMAQWWMEGFLERLLRHDDDVATALRSRAVMHIVPNMNPDGSRRGYLRTNAAGTDLNRAWLDPSLDTSPEVYLVRQHMMEARPDVFLDVHGDEVLPHCFIVGADGVPGWDERMATLLARFKSVLETANPDFQTSAGYPVPAPGQANLRIGTNYVGETFRNLAMTLEMPFKDTTHTPDATFGWSPARCRQLGSDCVAALADISSALLEGAPE